MILERKPLSMPESREYIHEDSETDIKGFLKKFMVLKSEKAKELRKKILDLDFLKVKEEHIAKVLDFMPETSEELNKIFNDVNLDEDETKKLLETIKGFR